MSEVGEQLVKNEKARKRCLGTAREAIGDLIARLHIESEQDLAELDISRAWNAISAISDQHLKMRVLRADYRRLGAQASGDDE